MGTLTRIARGLRAFRDICITISVVALRIIIRRVFHRFFDRSFNRNNSRNALILLSTCLSFFRRIICLIITKARLGGKIWRSHQTSSLFCCSTFKFRRLVIYQYNTSMGRLFNRLFRFVRFRQTIIRNDQ